MPYAPTTEDRSGLFLGAGINQATQGIVGGLEKQEDLKTKRKRVETILGAIDPEGKDRHASASLPELEGLLDAMAVKRIEARAALEEREAQRADERLVVDKSELARRIAEDQRAERERKINARAFSQAVGGEGAQQANPELARQLGEQGITAQNDPELFDRLARSPATLHRAGEPGLPEATPPQREVRGFRFFDKDGQIAVGEGRTMGEAAQQLDPRFRYVRGEEIPREPVPPTLREALGADEGVQFDPHRLSRPAHFAALGGSNAALAQALQEQDAAEKQFIPTFGTSEQGERYQTTSPRSAVPLTGTKRGGPVKIGNRWLFQDPEYNYFGLPSGEPVNLRPRAGQSEPLTEAEMAAAFGGDEPAAPAPGSGLGKGAPPAPAPAAAKPAKTKTADADRVYMLAPDGRTPGWIPKERVEEALKAGYQPL